MSGESISPPDPESGADSLVDIVMSGRRFIVIPYVFSVILLSFKRSMGGVHLVKTGEWPMGQLFGAATVTTLFGWCGMPMGIIWSVICLFYLWRGGKDVTLQLLCRSVGGPEAKRILAASPKPLLPNSIWLLRLLILIPMVVLTLVVFCILFPPPWI